MADKAFEVSVYHTDDYEIHKVGHPTDGAAVMYNLEYEYKTKEENGITYKAKVPFRNGMPYVTLVSLRTYGDDKETVYVDEDKPLDGGAGAAYARRLGEELILAAEYCEWLMSKE